MAPFLLGVPAIILPVFWVHEERLVEISSVDIYARVVWVIAISSIVVIDGDLEVTGVRRGMEEISGFDIFARLTPGVSQLLDACGSFRSARSDVDIMAVIYIPVEHELPVSDNLLAFQLLEGKTG
jgi:hypothetical protein